MHGGHKVGHSTGTSIRCTRVCCRTVARKSSIGGLYVCAGGLDIIKFDKSFTDVQCFIFEFWGA